MSSNERVFSIGSATPNAIGSARRRTCRLHVSGSFREKAFRAGETIYIAGDPAERLYIAATGKIKLVRDTPLGKSVLLDILAGGDFLGSLSPLGDKTYPETAVAHTDCCVPGVTAHDFENRPRLDRHSRGARPRNNPH